MDHEPRGLRGPSGSAATEIGGWRYLQAHYRKPTLLYYNASQHQKLLYYRRDNLTVIDWKAGDPSPARGVQLRDCPEWQLAGPQASLSVGLFLFPLQSEGGSPLVDRPLHRAL